MQNKKLLLLIALSIIAFFSLFYGVSTSSKARRGLQTEKITTEKGIVSFARSAKRSSYAHWARNPFTTSMVSIKLSGDFALDGILWDNKNPIAIINNRIVKIGDVLDGKTIVDIKQDRVILNDGSKDFELRLGR